MNSMPEILPDDPVLLKQMLNKMLVQMLSERQLYKGQIVDLKEQVKLLRDRLFGRKSEQTVESDTPQLALVPAVAANTPSVKKPANSWRSCRCKSA